MSKEIRVIMGYPASGKTSITKQFVDNGYHRINRDELGGSLDGVADKVKAALGSHDKIVVDNTYIDRQSRKSLLKVAKDAKVDVICDWMQTSIEDAQYNACWRMMERYGKVLSPDEIKAEKNAPNIFPLHVLYAYRTKFQPPEEKEGFAKINEIAFVRKHPDGFNNKALILDYDDTLRKSVGKHPWPEKIEDIEVLPKRKETLTEWKKKGYLLLGASNQSAIAKGNFTIEEAVAMFEHTNKLLGHAVDFLFDPTKVPPLSSYNRKPCPGMGVQHIFKNKLDPKQCIVVGDQKTDATFSKRIGANFEMAAKFFNDKV